MNKMTKYLTGRLKICAMAGGIILLAAFVLIWYQSFRYTGGYGVPLLFCAALILYIWFSYHFIIKPFKETKLVYEQFVLGHVRKDLFEVRYPFSPEAEQAIFRLEEMIDKGNLINVSKKQAEYLALQNQINPHFLYNTLEGIRSEALIAGVDSIAEMTEALATFFRYTISQVNHLVTLEDELANIENYYYIQQFRFGDKLALSIEYDHDDEMHQLDILKYRLPKLTLQPIVENSIYHGIERKIGKGHLKIKISLSDERLRIRVSDDGLGMEEEKLQEVNEKLRSISGDEMTEPAGKKGGIAIVNVNNRIRLLFGEEYGISVYSNVGAGTDVVIDLPIVTE